MYIVFVYPVCFLKALFVRGKENLKASKIKMVVHSFQRNVLL